MADLGTLRPTTYVTATLAWTSHPDNVLNDDSDSTYGYVSTNADGTYDAEYNFDNTPSDFGSILTCAIQFRRAWSATPTNTNWLDGVPALGALSAYIHNGATILAAADAGGTPQVVEASQIDDTSPTTGSSQAFAYVNTGASKATWDGAVVVLRIHRDRIKGGGSEEQRIHEVKITGTYTAAAFNAAIVGSTHITGVGIR